MEKARGGKVSPKDPRQTSPGTSYTHSTLHWHSCSERAESVPPPPVTLVCTSPCSFPGTLGAETSHHPLPGLPWVGTCITHRRDITPCSPTGRDVTSCSPTGRYLFANASSHRASASFAGAAWCPRGGDGGISLPSGATPAPACPPQHHLTHSCSTLGTGNARARIRGWGRPQ